MLSTLGPYKTQNINTSSPPFLMYGSGGPSDTTEGVLSSNTTNVGGYYLGLDLRTFDVVSTSTEDTAGVGDGIRKLVLTGATYTEDTLGVHWEIKKEDIFLDGTTPKPTVNQYYRVLSIEAEQVGELGGAAGIIAVQISEGDPVETTQYLEIPAGKLSSNVAAYFILPGKTLVIDRIHFGPAPRTGGHIIYTLYYQSSELFVPEPIFEHRGNSPSTVQFLKPLYLTPGNNPADVFVKAVSYGGTGHASVLIEGHLINA